MTSSNWWRAGAIYQIYPRSFQDSNGDGVGDLNGILARLDYLARLGVSAIWLSPVYPSPMYDFGYDISDHEDIDPVFGTLEEMQTLIREAHGRGIKVVMDLVLNHTSHLHPWFLESRASRDSAKRDWYLWRDPGPDGGPPNNWESVFGGKAWEYDPATGQYYYHQFLKEQPDLNWRNPAVRARLYQILRFWLERGVDGFRFDVIMSYFKDDLWRDNPPALGLRGYDRQKHIYDQNRPELMDVLADLRAIMNAYPGTMTVGEVESLDSAVRYVGPDKLDLAFNFDFLGQRWLPRLFQESILRYEASLPDGTWPCYVLGNHDRDRFPSRFGGGPYADARTKVAATLLLTQRGTPFIYYGEEIGMHNGRLTRDQLRDPLGQRYWPAFAGRDPARTPMQWEADGGFSPGVDPWLPLNDPATRNVAAQEADPRSILSTYRDLLSLRQSAIALREGTTHFLLKRPVEGLAYLRQHPDQTLLVALNFFGWPIDLRLKGPMPASRWTLRFTTVDYDVPRIVGDRMRLAPFEACVLEAQ